MCYNEFDYVFCIFKLALGGLGVRYTTGELNYCTGFTMEIQMKTELFVPEKTEDYYTLILFTNCCLSVASKTKEIYSGCGLLVLSPDHGITDIKILDRGENCSVQTLVFSSYGLNVNNKRFPDTYEYEFFNKLEKGYCSVDLTPKLLETFIYNFNNINNLMNIEQGHLWPCIVRSYVSEMVILLTRNQYLVEANKKCQPNADDKVNKVIEYFQYSYSKKITLDEVSKKFATNRTTLNSMFNRAYGVSAIAYLNKMRIQNASLMLTNTAMPICDIAQRTGFADVSYFSKAYKKMTGKTPTEYRLSIPHPHGLRWPESALSMDELS